MTTQLPLELPGDVGTLPTRTDTPSSCPYCGHRAAVHAGPGAPGADVVVGTCGERCGCPGWHPDLEPESCGRCGDHHADLLIVEGFGTWYCAACLIGHWNVTELEGDRRRASRRHAGGPVLAICWGAEGGER